MWGVRHLHKPVGDRTSDCSARLRGCKHDPGKLVATLFRPPSATRQSSSLQLRPRDSRLCVPASRQVCLYRVQSFNLKDQTGQNRLTHYRSFNAVFQSCQLFFGCGSRSKWQPGLPRSEATALKGLWGDS